jgi:glycosyltransferase involved in cell wall biosynthesis
MSAPTVSVVIPCYNDGQYLREAIESVLASTYRPIEVIVVNDGSTDSSTLLKLEELSGQGYTVVHQANQGQCSARNNGISRATGPYILSLDADNKVRPRYIELAVRAMELDASIGVVYGKFDHFGSSHARNIGRPFDPSLLLYRNFIDTLAVFRKSVWESIGGYDTQLKGNEDWDFWLNAHGRGVKFHFINEVMFDYRVKENSVTTMINQRENYSEFSAYFCSKHGARYRQAYCELYNEMMFAKSSPVKFLLKQQMPGLYARLKGWRLIKTGS